MVNETRAQFAYSRSAGAADRSDRPGGEHRIVRRGVVRHAVGQSDRPPEQDVRGRRQPVVSGRRARAARWAGRALQRRHDHVSAIDSRLVHVLVARELSGGRRTTTPGSRRRSARPSGLADEPQPRASTLQDEWKASPRLTLNAGLRYDLQWLETIQTDTEQPRRRARVSRGRPPAAGAALVRGSAGLFYDRVPLRAVANALLSAGNTTDLANLRQTNISLSPTQAGAPTFPNILSAPVPLGDAGQFHDDGPAHAERVFRSGERRVRAAARRPRHRERRLPVRARTRVDHLGQPERAVAAWPSGTNNGCRPNPTYANNSQYSPLAELGYHGLHVSFVQRPTRLGLLSRQLHAVEGHGQRRASSSSARRSIHSICPRTGADPTTTSAIVS